jgi:toxin ParE1/3/4
VTYEVRYTEFAKADLIALHAWIEEATDFETADRYLQRLERHCLALAEFPNRGTPRGDLGPEVRSLSFERRLVVFYRVENHVVAILRILSGARNLQEALQ